MGKKAWSHLDELERNYVLADHMEWAWAVHHVDLELVARGEHVVICELLVLYPGQDHDRHVMEYLCRWAGRAKVTLELSLTDQRDADTARLTQFFTAFGFGHNRDGSKSTH